MGCSAPRVGSLEDEVIFIGGGDFGVEAAFGQVGGDGGAGGGVGGVAEERVGGEPWLR